MVITCLFASLVFGNYYCFKIYCNDKYFVVALILFYISRLLGYEGVEVINPEGGKEDAEEEARRGRWKDEVGCKQLCWPYFLIF